MKRPKRSYKSRVPLDIVAEILARLPLKSIVTFRRVCKSWYSLVTEPFFASKQLALSHYVATKCRSYLILHHKNEFYAVSAEECKRTASLKPKKLKFPSMEAAKSSFSAKGNCNGLLCFSDLDKILLWNPLNGRVKEIPKSESQVQRLRRGVEKELIRFGFVSQTCDYKLVSIEDRVHLGFPQFETCTLRNPTWTTRTSIVDNNFEYQIHYTRNFSFCFPCVRSNLYFIARKRNRGSTEFNRFIVLEFDMLEDKFREIPLPNNADCFAIGRHDVGENRDTVVLFEMSSIHSLKTWVMKNDGDNNVGCKWARLRRLRPCISLRLFTICGEVSSCSIDYLLDILDLSSRKKTSIPFVDRMVVQYKEMCLALLDDEDCRN